MDIYHQGAMDERDQLTIWNAAGEQLTPAREVSPWPPPHPRRVARCNPGMLAWFREKENLTVHAVAKRMRISSDCFRRYQLTDLAVESHRWRATR
jgi:hypothetical protein